MFAKEKNFNKIANKIGDNRNNNKKKQHGNSTKVKSHKIVGIEKLSVINPTSDDANKNFK